MLDVASKITRKSSRRGEGMPTRSPRYRDLVAKNRVCRAEEARSIPTIPFGNHTAPSLCLEDCGELIYLGVHWWVDLHSLRLASESPLPLCDFERRRTVLQTDSIRIWCILPLFPADVIPGSPWLLSCHTHRRRRTGSSVVNAPPTNNHWPPDLIEPDQYSDAPEI